MNETNKETKMNNRYRVFYTTNGIKKITGNFNLLEEAEAHAKRIVRCGVAQYSEVLQEVK